MKLLTQIDYAQVVGGGCGSDTAAAVGAAVGTVGACANGVATASCVGAAIGTAAAVATANDSCTAATAAPPGSISCTPDSNPMGDTTGTTSCSDGGGGGGGGGGGSVICTELCRTGELDHATWVASMRYTNMQFSAQTMNGYHMWGVPYVNMMRKSRRFARWAKAPTTWFAEDNAYRMGERTAPNYKGMFIREVLFRPICWSFGLFAKASAWQGLWVGVSLRGLTTSRL